MSPKEYKNTELWHYVARWVRDLEDFGDIRMNSREDDVIGYICQQLDRDLLVSGSLRKNKQG